MHERKSKREQVRMKVRERLCESKSEKRECARVKRRQKAGKVHERKSEREQARMKARERV